MDAAGNVVALISPCIFIPVLTYALGAGMLTHILTTKTLEMAKPTLDNYDWQSMAAIRKGDDKDLADEAHIDLEMIPGEHTESEAEMAAEQAKLKKASVIAKTMTVVLTLSLLLLWPIPMYASGYVFSKGFFTGWVVVGIMWLFFSLGCVGIFPLWEGRDGIAHTIKAIFLDITGKQHLSKFHAHGAEITEGVAEGKSDGVDTPPTKGDTGEKPQEMKE
jgi:hypothetical protein